MPGSLLQHKVWLQTQGVVTEGVWEHLLPGGENKTAWDNSPDRLEKPPSVLAAWGRGVVVSLYSTCVLLTFPIEGLLRYIKFEMWAPSYWLPWAWCGYLRVSFIFPLVGTHRLSAWCCKEINMIHTWLICSHRGVVSETYVERHHRWNKNLVYFFSIKAAIQLSSAPSTTSSVRWHQPKSQSVARTTGN